MKSKLIACAVIIATTLSLSISVRCAAPSIADILPADSLGYVEVPDMGVLYYLIGEIGRSALQSLDEEAEIPQEIKTKARAVLEAFEEIKPLLPKSASLGVVSIDLERKDLLSLVLVSEMSEALAPLASAFGKLAAAAPEIKVAKTGHGIEVVIPHGPPPIGYAVKDNVVYLTMGQGLLDKVLSGQPSEKLSQTAAFKEVSAVTEKNQILSAYVNLDAVMEKLLPAVNPQAKQFVELLGLKELHAVGASLSADEKVVGLNVVWRFTENAPGIASLLSIPNTPPKGLAYVPEDFSYVCRFSLGPPEEFMKKLRELLTKAGLGEKVAQVFEQAKKEPGVDIEQLLASLDGEVTIGVKVPETFGIPNMVACLGARDPGYFLGTLKSLLTKGGMPFTEMEVSGRKTLIITPKMPVPITPAVAFDGDMVVMAVSSLALERALAAKTSGQNIASKPKFKAAFEGLPASSNIGLQYAELDSLGQLAVSGLGMLAASVPAEVKPAVGKAMQYANKAVQNLEPGTEVVYRVPNGLAIQYRLGTRSVMQILTNGAALGAKAAVWFAHREVRKPEEQPAEEPTPPSAVPAPPEPVPVPGS